MNVYNGIGITSVYDPQRDVAAVSLRGRRIGGIFSA